MTQTGKNAQYHAINRLSIIAIALTIFSTFTYAGCESSKNQGEAIQCLEAKIAAINNKKPEATLSIPNGAVVAFDLSECPHGWKEYRKLYGRFIRGIDKSGEKRDPDGERDLGSYQPDAFASHSHTLPRQVWSFSGTGSNPIPADGKGGAGVTGTNAVGESETRPKNISLLYCIKAD